MIIIIVIVSDRSCAFHVSAIVELKWMHSAAMHLFAKRLPADQFGTTLERASSSCPLSSSNSQHKGTAGLVSV